MSFIDFEDVTFAYTPVEGDLDAEGKQIIPPVLFDHFTARLPSSFVSIVGSNACGKSTLMLLASGRLKPIRVQSACLEKTLVRFMMKMNKTFCRNLFIRICNLNRMKNWLTY